MSTTERFTLPSGAWIQFRDSNTLRRGDKKKALKAVPVDETGTMSLATPKEMDDGLLQVLVMDWSYPFPIPAESPGSLELIPWEDDDALTEKLGPIRDRLFASKPDPVKDATDPASPTEPSAV
ncbi:hypothetical protein [Streptomyces cylindrosporus]|uniref:Uncharacterized protein n=1 Tax=Streptomyces cylindrosporus TaxID=2927583 RepID=A0ABS9YK82_9ACTN|nr:hypothetical protein [Streptomyces cylindrosporus]MCI3277657.1 hypothetical protein [Streptomyces cylindrosporus]